MATPAVETVIRRGLMARPSGEVIRSIADHIFIIEQGFTHTHKYNIAQFLAVDLFTLLVDQHHFIIDLIKFQVSFPFDIPGGTEFTTEGTADL